MLKNILLEHQQVLVRHHQLDGFQEIKSFFNAN